MIIPSSVAFIIFGYLASIVGVYFGLGYLIEKIFG